MTGAEKAACRLEKKRERCLAETKPKQLNRCLERLGLVPGGTSSDIYTYSASGDWTWHHLDHLSGTSLETDDTGQVVQLYDYYPFGDVRIDNHATGHDNDYQFTSKERDDDTGLLYYEARYYGSDTSRFISLDPWEGDLSDPQSLNQTAYVLNNPLSYNDPTGEVVQFVTKAIDYQSMPNGNWHSIEGVTQKLQRFAASFGSHTFVRAIPDNPQDFNNRNAFTFGAGQTRGTLIKGYNHPNDFHPSTEIFSIETIRTPEGMTDTSFIKGIESTFDGYNNDLSYDPLSLTGKNSNDFSTELINRAGGDLSGVSRYNGLHISPGLNSGGLGDDTSSEGSDQDDDS